VLRAAVAATGSPGYAACFRIGKTRFSGSRKPTSKGLGLGGNGSSRRPEGVEWGGEGDRRRAELADRGRLIARFWWVERQWQFAAARRRGMGRCG
jgi:hypothetical protein